jgi:bifunctional UDP-N-acetylglucosamine pyrophosphorylase/glucosamine-1-phosphate N-acetyltransferase
VVGYEGEQVRSVLKTFPNLRFAIQEKQLGTGHATGCALSAIDSGVAVILQGDVPLISNAMIQQIIDQYYESGKKLAFVSVEIDNPQGFGRVNVNEEGVWIIEEKDATEEIKKIKKVNTGVYVGEVTYIKKLLRNIANNNAQREYYLTDIVQWASRENQVVVISRDEAELFKGVNTREELISAELVYKTYFS